MSLNLIWFWTILTFLFLFLLLTNSESENARKALVTFMHKLEPPHQNSSTWGWNLTSDPCTHNWHGVTCYTNNQYIKSIVLEKLNFTGVLDVASLCIASNLQFFSLNNNDLHGFISEDIKNCKFLTHLLLSGNKFSGNLPLSIPQLRNLKRLHVSDNHFTGNLPNMVNVTSLISFLAQNNAFTGQIPDLDFSNFEAFNVSTNNLSGPVPLIISGSQSGHSLDWRSRLDVAVKIAEALAYMHVELGESGIAHGNLKSSNILFNKNMDPQISEYGLMVAENQGVIISHRKSLRNRNMSPAATFRADIYAFGVILLELLTGKVVKNDGFDLVKWVNSVISEEWTAEVFDQSLISQGASEERMVNLLQVALKCINPSPNDRLSMSQVAVITNALKDEDDKSISFDT